MTRSMTRFPLLAWAAAMALAWPLTGMAQGKKELAEKAVAMQQSAIDNMARNMANQVAQQVMMKAGQAMNTVAPDRRDALGKDVQAEVKKFYDDLEATLRGRAAKLAPATLGPMLEEKFTEDELKQLVAWLESPVAKKYQQFGGEMQSALTAKVVDDTRAAVEPKLQALDDKLKKRFSAETQGGARPPANAGSAAKPLPLKQPK